MSRDEIAEHAGYLRDSAKLHAYRSALAQLVRPGMSILDLGAGTGILGLLAAEAGARIVYAVDGGGIVGAVRSIADANGLEDRIVGIRGMSNRVVLPEQVDLVVCDQIGGLAYDAGVLEYFRDVRSRLLAPGGVLMPSSFQLYAAPVTTDYWAKTVGVWSARPGGFDLTPMAELAVNTEYRVELEPSSFLAEPAQFAKIESHSDEPISGVAELRVERGGVLHGVAGMFVAQLSPSVTLTNCPLWRCAFDRWQNFYPLRHPITVSKGDLVVTEFAIRPRSYLATWTVQVHAADPAEGVLTRHRGSTALGAMVSSEDLDVTRGASVPKSSIAVDADRYVFELVDGARSLAEIAELVRARHPETFTSVADAKARVTRLLSTYLHEQSPCAT